ncbi:MAG: hypothetical protein RIC36_19700 [Rhodospirillales bacterium]
MDAQAINALQSTGATKANIRGLKALKLQKEQEAAIANAVQEAADRGAAVSEARISRASSDGLRGTVLDISA